MTSLARTTAVMSFGTVLSRITGLGRVAAITAALGIVESGHLADTYNIGNTVPNMINELVLGGILTSVFVPVFVELLQKEGKERAWQVASALINVSLVLLVAIAAVAILAAPLIAKFYALRLEGDAAIRQQEVLTFLLRLFIPQIIFYALAAMSAGLLNAHKRFAAPMYTPILNNLAVIAVFIGFRQAYADSDLSLESISNTQLLIIGGGTTAGVVLMAISQLPALRGLGRYKLTFSIGDPAIRKLANLSVFVIGYVVTNQLGLIVVQWLANRQQGGYSAYVSAFMFFMLPHGLFAVSVITALLPGMSEHAVNQRWGDFRDRLSTGTRLTFLLILPASVGFLVLGEPVVRLLLEHGLMTAKSTELVAGVLRFFVLGLVPFSLFQLFSRAFHALQDTKTPFLINCGAVALNTGVNVPLFAWLGVKGLAAGHALAYVFGISLQGRALSKRLGGLDLKRLMTSGSKIGTAALGMGALVWVTSKVTTHALGVSPSLTGQILAVALPVIVGVGSYVAFAILLRVEEMSYARKVLKGKLGKP